MPDSNIHPIMRSALFPFSPDSISARRARGFISDELRHFSAAVRQAELTIRLALSSAMISTSCAEHLIADNHVHDMMQDIFGKQFRDIVGRLDDAGADVSSLTFPTCEPDQAA